jgi:hypothetical protein
MPESGLGLSGSEVRFAPQSRHRLTRWICPLCAKSGHSHCSIVSLFDHLVGASEQHRRHFKAERPGSLQVDGQVELGRTLDR